MSKLTDTLIVWRLEDASEAAGLWVCEWQADASGEFFIQAAHYFGARQIAKRVLRDHLKPAGNVSFQVCEAGVLDRDAHALAQQQQQRLQFRICGIVATGDKNTLANSRLFALQAKPTGG